MKKYIKANIIDKVDITKYITEEDAKTIGNDNYSNYRIYKEKQDQIITINNTNTNIKEFLEKEFTQRTSKKLRKIDKLIVNEEYPFAIGKIDKAVVGEDAFLITNIKPYFDREKYKNNVPKEDLYKIYHLMALSKATKAYVLTLIGNEEIYINKVDNDPKEINKLMAKEETFVNDNLKKNIAPTPLTESEYNVEKGLLLYEKESMINHYDEVIGKIKSLEQNKKVIEEALKEEMKYHEVAYIGNRKITYKTTTRNTIDAKKLREECPEIAKMYTKTTTSRTLKIN